MKRMYGYRKGFIPYGLAAFLIGIVGGFSTVLGPAFVQDAGLPYNNTTWTALAQAVSTAACAPILGKLGDVLGRRSALLLGLAVFTLGNFLTAFASSLLFMMAARFVVGIGTAAVAPVILAYIVTEFPPHEAGKGFSLYMLISSASVIFGPTLGSLLIAASGWRTMIWVCAALCVAVFFPCLFLTDKSPVKRGTLTGFDGAGAALVLVFFALLLCVPSFGQNFGWNSAPFLAVLIAAAVSLAGLIFAEGKAETPILPARFMATKAFVLSVSALFLAQGLMQANMTNLIVFVRHTQPENAMISGYAISVMYLGMSLGAALLSPLADRVEPKSLLTGSFLLTGAGCSLLFLFSEATPRALLVLALGILGVGLGGNGTVFLKVVLSGLAPEQAGTATGTYSLFRDLAAPFGVAVFVPMFTNGITARMAAGAGEAAAAVRSIHALAAAELLCVAAGILLVRMLPRLRPRS